MLYDDSTSHKYSFVHRMSLSIRQTNPDVFIFRCFSSVMLVCTYSLVAMLSKETGVMVLPIVVIYHLYCREGNITHLCRDKDTCRTVLKYVAMVSVHFFSLWIIISMFQTTVLVYLRTSLNGTSPIFSEQDNPASFATSSCTR